MLNKDKAREPGASVAVLEVHWAALGDVKVVYREV